MTSADKYQSFGYLWPCKGMLRHTIYMDCNICLPYISHIVSLVGQFNTAPVNNAYTQNISCMNMEIPSGVECDSYLAAMCI